MSDEGMNKPVEDLIDKYFPKGHQGRGRALVIGAIATLEIQKAREEAKLEILKTLLMPEFGDKCGKCGSPMELTRTEIVLKQWDGTGTTYSLHKKEFSVIYFGRCSKLIECGVVNVMLRKLKSGGEGGKNYNVAGVILGNRHIKPCRQRDKEAGSNPAPAKTKYVCRQHGDSCRSYVEGLVEELEKTGRKPTKEDLKLVKERETALANSSSGESLCRCDSERQSLDFEVRWVITDGLGKRHHGKDIVSVEEDLEDVEDCISELMDSESCWDSSITKAKMANFSHKCGTVDVGVKDWQIKTISACNRDKEEAEPTAKPRTKRVGEGKNE